MALRLLSVNVKQYRCLQEFSAQFNREGPTGFVGCNNTGKTSFLDFVYCNTVAPSPDKPVKMIGASRGSISYLKAQRFCQKTDWEWFATLPSLVRRRFGLCAFTDGYDTTTGQKMVCSVLSSAMRRRQGYIRRQKSPDVLLVDDFDAFLSPKWQEKLLLTLRECAPTCQLIFTMLESSLVDSQCDYVRFVSMRTGEQIKSENCPMIADKAKVRSKCCTRCS